MTAIKKLSLDEDLEQDLIHSVSEVFEQTFSTRLTQLDALRAASNVAHEGDISGIVGMIQNEIEGTLLICLPKDTILTLIEPIYGRQFESIDESVKQCVGEISNMIYGQLKKALNERGYSFQMALPSVVVGAKHQLYTYQVGLSLKIQFSCPAGHFDIVIALKNG